MEENNKKELEEDAELAALRLAALATLKPNKKKDNSTRYALPIGSIVTVPSNAPESESSQIPFVQSDRKQYNTYSFRKQNQPPRWRGGNFSFQKTSHHRSNLIVISPVCMDGSKESDKPASMITLPQHKWCNSGNEDSMSPKTLRKTGPTRFNRHGSDSESSDSDFENSVNDSASNETVLQDEPEHFTPLPTKNTNEVVSKTVEKQRRLSFQNLESEMKSDDFDKNETTSIYNCLKNSSSLQNQNDDRHTWNLPAENNYSGYKEYSSDHSFSTEPLNPSSVFSEKLRSSSHASNGESHVDNHVNNFSTQASEPSTWQHGGLQGSNPYYSMETIPIPDNHNISVKNDRNSEYSDKRHTSPYNKNQGSEGSWQHEERTRTSTQLFSRDTANSINYNDNSLSRNDLRLELKKRLQEYSSKTDTVHRKQGQKNNWDRNRQKYSYKDNKVSEECDSYSYRSRRERSFSKERTRSDNSPSPPRRRHDRCLSIDRSRQERSSSRDKKRHDNKSDDRSRYKYSLDKKRRRHGHSSSCDSDRHERSFSQDSSRRKHSSSQESGHDHSSSQERSRQNQSSSRDRYKRDRSSSRSWSSGRDRIKHTRSSSKGRASSERSLSQVRDKHEWSPNQIKSKKDGSLSHEKSRHDRSVSRDRTKHECSYSGERRRKHSFSGDRSRREHSSSVDSKHERSVSQEKTKIDCSSSRDRNRHERSSSRSRSKYMKSKSEFSSSHNKSRFECSSSLDKIKKDSSQERSGKGQHSSEEKDKRQEHSTIQEKMQKHSVLKNKLELVPKKEENKEENESTKTTEENRHQRNRSIEKYRKRSRSHLYKRGKSGANFQDHYRRSRSRSSFSSSSSSSSFSSNSSRPKIRSVPSVIKSVPPKTSDAEKKETFNDTKSIGKSSHTLNFQLDHGFLSSKKGFDIGDQSKVTNIKSGRVECDLKNNASDSNKRVPVHMRLGAFPRKRVIQMTKDVEAAFVNSSSSSDSENVSNKFKRQNMRIVADVYGNKGEMDSGKNPLEKEIPEKKSPDNVKEKSRRLKINR